MRLRVVVAAASLLLSTSCVGVVPTPTPSPSPTASEAPATTPGIGRFETQRVAWASCGGLECGVVEVPLDYAMPDRRTIELGVTRRAATRQPRLGTLFVNPGGPGGSGRDMVRFLDPDGLERYDIVGWDPRGVGVSSPVTCLQGADADAYLELDSSPDTPAESAALAEGAREFAAACLANSGADLLANIATVDTVRDLDILRAVVGDDQLHYLGVSYGTQIGADYARLFPQRVGRLVLDAAVDITDSRAVPQTVGFDRALGNFAAWCARTPSCGLGATPDAVVAGLRADLDRLDTDPLPVGDRRLTQGLAVTGIAASLYAGEDAWPLLAGLVRRLRAGEGEALLALADELNSRNPDGTYGGLFSSFPAISCVDEPREDAAAADRAWEADRQKAPFFGFYAGPWYTCANWPVPPKVAGPTGVRWTNPILVIGATGDPATPFEWAQATAAALDPSVLLTYDGEGHGAYGGRSRCVDATVQAFLVEGRVPAPGTVCR